MGLFPAQYPALGGEGIVRPVRSIIQAKTASKLLLAVVLLVGFLGCQLVPAKSDPVANASPSSESAITLAQYESTNSSDDELKPLPVPESIAIPIPDELNSGEGQSVEYFIGIAVSSHPRVRAARARVVAASNRVPQAQSLEDPLLSNNFYPISDQALQTAAGRAGNTLSLAQKYPWPEKRWTKGAIAEREMRIAAAKLAQTELEVEEMVRLAYYELWFSDRAIEITEDNLQIAAELVKLAEARNAAGGSQQDILRAQLQVDNLDNRIIELHRQKALAQADLAALVQQPEMIGIEPTAEIDVTRVPERLDALFVAAQQCSPRLRELRWAISRNRQKQELACLGKYPDLVLGAGWQTMTETAALSPVANGHDNVNFVVGITLPIWRDRIDAAIREASAEVAASSRDFNDARDDAFRQIRRLSEQAFAADEQVRLYNQRILPRAKRALQLASAEYRGRQVDFGEVASGFTEVLMFELQVVRVQATLAGTMAQLHRAVGCEVIVDDSSRPQPKP